MFYNLNEISFLEKCNNIEGVHIVGNKISDFSGLYHLEKLKKLYVDEPNGELDSSLIKHLEDFTINDEKYLRGLNECKNLKVL